MNPGAFAAAKPGQSLPDGMRIILADRQGAIGVQRKETGWREVYGRKIRNGAWDNDRFTGDGSRRPADTGSRVSCRPLARPPVRAHR